MKSIYYYLTLVSISMLLFSCDINNQTETEQVSISTNLRETDPSIKITGKPHRATELSGKGVACCCEYCFGVCEVEIDIDLGLEIKFSALIIEPNETLGKSRVYFLEELEHFESEFSIDEEILIPEEALVNSVYNFLSLLEGNYTFHEEQGEVIFENEPVITYGYVDVNHELY